jgi:hypothetical protein
MEYQYPEDGLQISRVAANVLNKHTHNRQPIRGGKYSS